jgi:hypothetical protein
MSPWPHDLPSALKPVRHAMIYISWRLQELQPPQFRNWIFLALIFNVSSRDSASLSLLTHWLSLSVFEVNSHCPEIGPFTRFSEPLQGVEAWFRRSPLWKEMSGENDTFSSKPVKEVGTSIWKWLGNKCCDPQNRGQKYEEEGHPCYEILSSKLKSLEKAWEAWARNCQTTNLRRGT